MIDSDILRQMSPLRVFVFDFCWCQMFDKFHFWSISSLNHFLCYVVLISYSSQQIFKKWICGAISGTCLNIFLIDRSIKFIRHFITHTYGTWNGLDKTFFTLKNEEISVTNFKAQNQHVNPIPFQLHRSQYILLSRTKDHRKWIKNHERPLTKRYIYGYKTHQETNKPNWNYKPLTIL